MESQNTQKSKINLSIKFHPLRLGRLRLYCKLQKWWAVEGTGYLPTSLTIPCCFFSSRRGVVSGWPEEPHPPPGVQVFKILLSNNFLEGTLTQEFGSKSDGWDINIIDGISIQGHNQSKFQCRCVPKGQFLHALTALDYMDSLNAVWLPPWGGGTLVK